MSAIVIGGCAWCFAGSDGSTALSFVGMPPVTPLKSLPPRECITMPYGGRFGEKVAPLLGSADGMTIMCQPHQQSGGHSSRPRNLPSRSTAVGYYIQRHYFGPRFGTSTRLSSSLSAPSEWIRTSAQKGATRLRCTKGSLSGNTPASSAGCIYRRPSGLSAKKNSVTGYRRPPPEDEEDIWSRGSVFEFRSLNDPETNASLYQGFRKKSADPEPIAAELPPMAYADEEPEEVSVMDDEASSNDWFRFQEKGMLSRSGNSQEDTRKIQEQILGGSTEARVELATQLGLPASATYDELRGAYRIEIKRCHPDMAGDNDFRVKMLERRFQRLTVAWDTFAAELQACASPKRPTKTSPRTESELGQPQTARERARAKADLMEAQAKARAEAAVAEYGIDSDREYLDVGGSSC